MPLLEEITELLAGNTGWVVGSTTGTVGVWGGFDADLGGEHVVVYETGGFTPEEVFGSTAPAFENPTIQIVSRSTSYQAARANAELAYRSVRVVTNQNLNSTFSSSTAYYLRIQPRNSPFMLGRDDKNRVLIGFNCSVQRAST